MMAAAETGAGAPGEEQTLFDRVAELERQLQEAQAKLDRQRAQRRATVQRWRQRNPELARQQDAARARVYRARRRERLLSESASEQTGQQQEREAPSADPELPVEQQQLRRER